MVFLKNGIARIYDSIRPSKFLVYIFPTSHTPKFVIMKNNIDEIYQLANEQYQYIIELIQMMFENENNVSSYVISIYKRNIDILLALRDDFKAMEDIVLNFDKITKYITCRIVL